MPLLLSPSADAKYRMTTAAAAAAKSLDHFEQIVVLFVVCVAALIFVGVFTVFCCRCSKRCPSYGYSRALFDGGHRSSSSRPCTTTGPDQLQTLTAPSAAAVACPGTFSPSSFKRRSSVDDVSPAPAFQLPLYSDTFRSSGPVTPPPEYDSLSQPQTLSRPPTYRSFTDKHPDAT